MSAVDGLPSSVISSELGSRDPATGALPALCPYLATLDGTWRSATAVREHRCMAVSPPVQLAAEKQRRLCLVDRHVDCATYGAAIASRAESAHIAGPVRPVARMTPVIFDRGRFDLRIPSIRADRGTGQAALVTVLGIALVAVLLARPSGDAGAIVPLGTAAVSDGPSSAPTDAAVAPSVAATSPDAAPTEPPSPTEPSATSSAAPPTATPATPSPGPVTSGATYKVKSGDTLSAIAARFGTTTRVLVQLNGIADPSRLKIGQILKLP